MKKTIIIILTTLFLLSISRPANADWFSTKESKSETTTDSALRTSLANALDSNANLVEQNARLMEKLKELSEERDKFLEQVKLLNKERDNLKGGMELLSDRVTDDIVSATEKLELVREENKRLTAQFQKLEEAKDRLSEDLGKLVKDNEQLREDFKEKRFKYSKPLQDEVKRLEKEVARLKGEEAKYGKELQKVYKTSNKTVKNYEKELEKLKVKSAKIERDLNKKIDKYKTEIKNLEEKKRKKEVDKINKENVDLAKEAGKTHYNLGIILFQAMKYEQSLTEYLRAQELMPYDPDVQFNLAVLYDDYLNDNPKAIYHYKRYLELSPKAKDAELVMEKIIQAEHEEAVRIGWPMDNQPPEAQHEYGRTHGWFVSKHQ